jgi:hypothetical protein
MIRRVTYSTVAYFIITQYTVSEHSYLKYISSKIKSKL